MSLDTAQKRGSAISIGLPWREWKVAPSGTLDVTARQSLIYLGSAIASGSVTTIPTRGCLRINDHAAWGLVVDNYAHWEVNTSDSARWSLATASEGCSCR